MTAIRPRRSALYLPGSNARAIEKARQLPCDVVILDLEDAVAPDAKAVAREQVVAAVASGGFGRREVIIRVNGLDTPWGAEDLEAVANVRPDGVLVPKVSDAKAIHHCVAAVGGRTNLWAMIETCSALLRLEAIAAASAAGGVKAWVIGTNDLAKEMRCRTGVDRTPLVAALTLSVAAARSAGLTILDGVFNEISDETGFSAQCEAGASLGFDGKTLIHPSQIEAANQAFSPTTAELDWAQLVAAAFAAPENANRGAIKVEGRMVERLHLDDAHRILALAAAATG